VAAVGPGAVVDLARRIDDDAPARLLPREVEQTDAPVGARDAEFAVAVLDVACARLEVRRREFARLVDRLGREPALPKPVPRSVSPCTMRMRSIGTPNTSTASCA